MILRTPDYYKEFSCIADRCKDSCCIGWEIDIDEDTCERYEAYCDEHRNELAERISTYLYQTDEGDMSFALAEKGRCPFLNQCNLCDIYIQMGEDALSEVCTEYPRFGIEYGDILQKCMSLSCEEVGRLVFTRETPVTFVEEGKREPGLWEYEADEDEEDFDPEEFKASAMRLEQLQRDAIGILQNRSISVTDRLQQYLTLFAGEGESSEDTMCFDEDAFSQEQEETRILYELFCERLKPFLEMETLDQEWVRQKHYFEELYNEESYERLLKEFMDSPDYRENDYEQLAVYFTFRYLMNAVYDYDTISYAKLAVVFTLLIRDMDAIRYHQNGGHYSVEDRIDTARIFSKEVEHSPDNVELAREAFLFDEVFEIEMLRRQIG